jgi:hypothetical protein
MNSCIDSCPHHKSANQSGKDRRHQQLVFLEIIAYMLREALQSNRRGLVERTYFVDVNPFCDSGCAFPLNLNP